MNQPAKSTATPRYKAMADSTHPHPYSMNVIYVLVCLVLIFLHLLPLDTLPRRWAGPDMMLAITLAWVLRRPDYVPPILIAIMFLLTDLLYQRPPGLWAALVLLSAEGLRSRAPGLRDLTFLVEWLNVATTLALLTLGYRIILGVLLVDQAPLGLSLMQMVATVLFYPVAVFLSQVVFGVRRLAPGDINPTGIRS